MFLALAIMIIADILLWLRSLSVAREQRLALRVVALILLIGIIAGLVVRIFYQRLF